MSVSYANVAARKESKPDIAEDVAQAADLAPQPQEGDQPENGEISASEPTEAPKKEKKVLTPAPVPLKSVWGALPAASVSMDEHKWPTPDKIPQIEQSQTPKALKPARSSKWVPLNAKVVLPNPRTAQSNGQTAQAKTKRKNKNQRKNKAAPFEAKKDDAKDDMDELAGSELTDDTTPHDNLDAALQNYDGRQRFQKNYKKFGQNGTENGNRAQQQRHLQGYYHSYVPQNYQGRYRPVNGNGAAYGRVGNGNYGVNYVPSGLPFVPLPQHPQPMMGVPFGAPVPVQIPPPISPKQNPQQALTQQVDYYFSLDNLIRDMFLRKNMGTEGWVDLDLILNFKRVKIIINGIRNSIEEADEQAKEDKLDNAILRAVQQCQNLEIGYLNGKEAHDARATEVQLRVKHAFEQWLLPDN